MVELGAFHRLVTVLILPALLVAFELILLQSECQRLPVRSTCMRVARPPTCRCCQTDVVAHATAYYHRLSVSFLYPVTSWPCLRGLVVCSGACVRHAPGGSFNPPNPSLGNPSMLYIANTFTSFLIAALVLRPDLEQHTEPPHYPPLHKTQASPQQPLEWMRHRSFPISVIIRYSVSI